MTHEELMKLLNLKPQSPKNQPNNDPLSPTQKSPQTNSSIYALKLNEYEKSIGSKLLRHNKEIKTTELEPEAISDFYALNYLTVPELETNCTDERKQEFVNKVLETNDYKALHRSTELNAFASELATTKLAENFAKLVREDEEREEKLEQRREQGKPINEKREQLRNEMLCNKAVNAALKEANQEVEEYEESMSALGCGLGEGSNDKLDPTKVVSIYQRIKDSYQLHRIMELAGRYIRTMYAKQHQKVQHGYDDMVGVVMDGDVGRLLPHELALLSIPEFELDSMRKLVEKQSMCREYKGVEKIGKGPVVITIDESGSMSGEPVCQAKAFALAMARLAKHQNRWVCLCSYSGGTEGLKLALPPGKWDELKLLEWLEHFYGGGTTLDVPLDVLPNQWWPELLKQGMKKGKTDLIVLTDALVHLPPEMEANFLRWKEKEQVRCISLVLGNSAGDLKKVSDEVYEIPHVNLQQEAITRCLSI